MSTAYHAKYFAYELTKRSGSDTVEKFASTLADAQVDLNPHQIEAALFAFRSPFSKGAILADEVGLGKTIEAGILLAQKWAERKRRLLVICPANLRKQWSQELADKFFLPSAILENKTFGEALKTGNLNPFHTGKGRSDKVVICSFQFARGKEHYVRQTEWDLIVIDEAHRLRNVYKPTNKIANAIKQAVSAFPKVLLTATPLQNSLLELYGLVSIIDDFAFGDLKSFRAQFTRLTDEVDFAELTAYAELDYSPPSPPAAPVGAITEYSATIGSLTKISGVQHTTLGNFPHAVRGTLAPFLMGHFTHPLNGTWLISTPGSTPAVQLPAGMIVSVCC